VRTRSNELVGDPDILGRHAWLELDRLGLALKATALATSAASHAAHSSAARPVAVATCSGRSAAVLAAAADVVAAGARGRLDEDGADVEGGDVDGVGDAGDREHALGRAGQHRLGCVEPGARGLLNLLDLAAALADPADERVTKVGQYPSARESAFGMGPTASPCASWG
jgi:hypothetical protein